MNSSSSLIDGTSLSVRLDRVVDGDTIRVFLPGAEKSESVRIMSLDTEETFSFSSKPRTPWGNAAKIFAKSYFEGVEEVTLEFPGNDDVEVALKRYRGNFGRLLVWVYKDGEDYQEVMIRRGYSPYYCKYGFAEFLSHHKRYTEAERFAQARNVGVWDQISVNGSVLRDYALLMSWWHLRASIIETYRALRASDPKLKVYNTRKDYEKLQELAASNETVTVFTEVRRIRNTFDDASAVSIGSIKQSFDIIIPDSEDSGKLAVQLLSNRYLAESESKPRRSYCYITGRLRVNPRNESGLHLIVNSADAITDEYPARTAEELETVTKEPTVGVRIVSCLPDPEGRDLGAETVTIGADGMRVVELEGWELRDAGGRKFELSGNIMGGNTKTFVLNSKMRLNNTGDTIELVDSSGKVVNVASYTKNEVVSGEEIKF